MYTCSLSDIEWKPVSEFLEDNGITDAGRKHRLRDVLDGIFYVVDNGVKWRNLPKDFPPWSSVYYNFRELKLSGIWEELSLFLVSVVRCQSGREPNPSLVSIDSQSQDGDSGIHSRGIDGHKKRNGRKRHIAVDVMGLVLLCICAPANEPDAVKGESLIKKLNDKLKFPNLLKALGDNAYKGVGDEYDLQITVENEERKPKQKGFVPEAFRWAVERTFAWLNWQRRLVRNYEKTLTSQESMIYIGNIRICLRRILKYCYNP